MHISVGYISRMGLLGQRVHLYYFNSLEIFQSVHTSSHSLQVLHLLANTWISSDLGFFFLIFFFRAAYYSDFIFSVVIYFLKLFFPFYLAIYLVSAQFCDNWQINKLLR